MAGMRTDDLVALVRSRLEPVTSPLTLTRAVLETIAVLEEYEFVRTEKIADTASVATASDEIGGE